METFLNVLMVLAVIFVVFLIIGLGFDFTLTMKNGNGYISQDNNSSAYSKIIKEENGCVYYVDVWGNEGKICGSYQIKTLK